MGGGGLIDIKGEVFKVRKNPAFITLYICRELIILIYVLISLFTFIILLPPHYPNFLDFPVKGPKVCHFFFFSIFFSFLKKNWYISSFIQIISFVNTILKKMDFKVLCPLNEGIKNIQLGHQGNLLPHNFWSK